jgi:hypothetical protein
LPFYRRRSMGRATDQLRNNSHNHNKHDCDHDSIAIDVE